MTTLQKLTNKIHELVPETMELTRGCVVRENLFGFGKIVFTEELKCEDGLYRREYIRWEDDVRVEPHLSLIHI